MTPLPKFAPHDSSVGRDFLPTIEPSPQLTGPTLIGYNFSSWGPAEGPKYFDTSNIQLSGQTPDDNID